MRGLIIKDFYCLKKQIITFCVTLLAVVILSIMFVLSSRYGNIATGYQEMVAEGEMSATNIPTISKYVVLIFMLIPIACTGDITSIFEDDRNASFAKLAYSFPISIKKRVACRFILGIFFIGIGVITDIVLTFVLASLTDYISVRHFCGGIITFASIMLIFISFIIFVMYLSGGKKINVSNYVTAVVIVLFALFFVYARTKVDFGADEAVMSKQLTTFYMGIVDTIFDKSYVFAIVAMLIATASYFGSVAVAKRKRGVA